MDQDTLFQEAIGLIEAAKFAEAESLCQQLLEAGGRQPPVVFLHGLLAYHQKDPDAAVSRIQEALQGEPGNASYHATLGAILIEIGRRTDAIEALERAVALNRDDLGSLRHLARQYAVLGRLKEAAQTWRVISDAPGATVGDSIALGETRERLQDLNGALKTYLEARQRYPVSVSLLNHLAACQQKLGMLGDAITNFEASLEIAVEGNPAVIGAFAAKQMSCDWIDFEKWRSRVKDVTDASMAKGTAGVEDPFMHITHCDDPEKNLRVAELWSEAIASRVAGWGAQFTHSRTHTGPIRVGYLSSDFHDHATAHLMAGLFAAHDRSRIAVHAYSCSPDDGSTYRRTIQSDCDSFTDLSNSQDVEAAQKIHNDGIDILVDLKGHTRNNRLEIAAMRPAPLQVAWLGFPGSSGADFFDYVIVDDIVAPAEDAPFYSESLAVMPVSYQINNDMQSIDKKEITRKESGLPEDGFVFASFNNTYKYEPVMFAAWMDILKAVPESVLWLQANNSLAIRNLQQCASSSGVDPSRLLFADMLPKSAHLRRIALADLALDTRIYNGHTTTSDALWAGVPVLTLKGRHFASRVSASLLTACGLPELITGSISEYRNNAIHLASDRGKSEALRRKVVQRRASAGLFDTVQFARDLETAFGEMWRRYRNGEPVSRLAVAELRT